ncbi:MAG: NlpC/P60 family protein [Planctomycetota bacterium]|nr:NlpC/P60 family protein [Planctomycetota bacterium]
MKICGADIVKYALLFRGTPYRYGAETEGLKAPMAFDCSEFVEFVLRHLGITFPDGSYNQYPACRDAGLLIEIDRARGTPGALVFRRHPMTNRINHVAICDGLNGTIEARGTQWGTGCWPWRPGWSDAGLVPGVYYK